MNSFFIVRTVVLLLVVPNLAFASDFKGHGVLGSIADQMPTDNARVVDPDKGGGTIDPKPENAGGNFISDQVISFHTAWHAIPLDLGESVDAEMIPEAKTVTTFVQGRPRHWVDTFADRQSYLRNQNVTKRRQIARSVERRAQILNEVWP
jgi:hypothetical protein